MSNIIEIKNLNFGYTQQNILEDFSLEVSEKSFVAIAGPNGAGKSTLLNLICRQLKPKSGSIKIEGKPIESYSPRKLARKIAIVHQEFLPIFDFTVAETVMMGRTPYLSGFGYETQADTEIVAEALKLTDTDAFASRILANLSGGERQRVLIARALAQNSPILLLDEPTSFLDLKHQVGIYDLLKQAQLEKGKTIVTITHDINLAAQYAETVLLLSAQAGYYTGTVKEIFCPEKIEKVFGVKTFAGDIGKEKFFLPLGKFSKDRI